MKVFITSFLILFGPLALAQQVWRPGSENLSFKLVESHTGSEISCTHELLDHVPWWKVICSDSKETREYTVDAWVQIRERGDLKENTLMYHVKESTSSSGTKLTQFKSHFTSFITRGDSELIGIVSQLDVRNGLADLVVTLK
jgi:hypothetical protein